MKNPIEIVSLEEMQETEYALAEIEDELSGTYVPVRPVKVFGVLPKKSCIFSFLTKKITARRMKYDL